MKLKICVRRPKLGIGVLQACSVSEQKAPLILGLAHCAMHHQGRQSHQYPHASGITLSVLIGAANSIIRHCCA